MRAKYDEKKGILTLHTGNPPDFPPDEELIRNLETGGLGEVFPVHNLEGAAAPGLGVDILLKKARKTPKKVDSGG